MFKKNIKTNQNIALYGIGGLYNYGCEAIVRGTTAILRQAYPDCHITYYSRQSKIDSCIINDLNIEIKQISHKAVFLTRIINKALRLCRIRWQIPYDDYSRVCNNHQVIFSIGGDMYTIPKISMESKKSTYNQLVQFGEYAKKNNNTLIIWGASIGPFGKYSKNINYFINHFKKVNHIFCRENHSIEYLKKMYNAKNISFYPDPAFFVKGDFVEQGNNNSIAINLSRLSLQEYYGKILESHFKSIADLIVRVAEVTGRRILLVPHVVPTKVSSENDLTFLIEILSYIPDDKRDCISLADNCTSFLAVKKILSSCDMVIAARMHCAINALCEGIPTIFLSYSEKSRGIAEYIYGDSQWVIVMDEINDRLVNLTQKMLESRDELSDQIRKKISDIRTNGLSEKAGDELKRYI